MLNPEYLDYDEDKRVAKWGFTDEAGDMAFEVYILDSDVRSLAALIRTYHRNQRKHRHRNCK